MFDATLFFVESLDLREHPIKKSKERIRTEYYTALSYIVNQVIENAISTDDHICITSSENTAQVKVLGKGIQSAFLKKHITERLELYRKQFALKEANTNLDTDAIKRKSLQSVSACVSRPWRKKHRLWLMCDVALITLDHVMIKQSAEIIKGFLIRWQREELDLLVSSLLDLNITTCKFSSSKQLISQYHLNDSFAKKTEQGVIVTANMSAGKSTLINALIGKPLARTSQEVCTGNLCYLYNKPFEDGCVHLASPELNLDTNEDALSSYQWQGAISIASHFSGVEPKVPRLCIIDTPGVNAALYKEHSKITHNALTNLKYDKVLYVVSPTNLGTYAEIKHLKWVAENVPKEKIIFVLNKLDDYHSSTDNVGESIDGLRSDLVNIGFENPVICPISAYFGLLLKMKLTGQELTEDEQDEYALLAKKFNKPSYDLSRFYNGVQCNADDANDIRLSKKSGLYGLEKLIYGGMV
ncbi:dynamin family protein [Lacrimispora brassicae]